MNRLSILALLLAILSTPLAALTPEEQLTDPALESRARAISAQLRCLVCQNQTIDDSDADLAQDLRSEVRTLLTQGFSDAEILAEIRATYGDYVLFNPPINTATGLLWATPILLVLLSGLGLYAMQRRRRPPLQPDRAEPLERPAFTDKELSRRIILSGILVICLITAGLYAMLGRPDIEARPLQARQTERIEAEERARDNETALQKTLAEAQSAIEQNPDSVELHLRLAMVAAEAEIHHIELEALDEALRLTEDRPAIKAMKAEALSRKAGGLVTIPARNLIVDVLAIDPTEPRALYLFGLAAYQDEDYLTALSRWRQLQATIDPTSPLAERIAINITDAENRGSIAELPQEERDEMIINMVESLELRLEEDPDNPQAWDRLIAARQTLEDREGLIRAALNAAQAYPDQLARQVAALEIIILENQESTHLDDALILLERISSIAPRSPEFLFFSGHFALLSGETSLAISLWQELESQLDDSNPTKAQLQEQIKLLQEN